MLLIYLLQTISLAALSVLPISQCLLSRPSLWRRTRISHSRSLGARIALSATTSASVSNYVPVLDFSKPETIDQVDRLDDAIMGGISTSSVQPGNGFARWGGICRTDGGGFCGFRTNPMETPLQPGSASGLYVECRLASDNEPERRVWKVTTRTKPDRGELLYQAPLFNVSSSEYTKILLPFSSFQLVRGPNAVRDGPSLNTTKGLYQFGMTMSKFAWNRSGEIENFRDGLFELHVKEMGLYYGNEEGETQAVASVSQKPAILSRQEAKKNRSRLLKIILPIVRVVFFSEQSQRRKSAMRILRTERKLTRLQAILFGLRWRRRSSGLAKAGAGVLSILAMDSFRTMIRTILRIVTFPLVALLRIVRVSKESPEAQ